METIAISAVTRGRRTELWLETLVLKKYSSLSKSRGVASGPGSASAGGDHYSGPIGSGIWRNPAGSQSRSSRFCDNELDLFEDIRLLILFNGTTSFT